MDEPVTSWRHTHARDTADADCSVFLPDNQSLLLYNPASTTGGAWLHSDQPLDLRAFA